jgi:hypothetical protein
MRRVAMMFASACANDGWLGAPFARAGAGVALSLSQR